MPKVSVVMITFNRAPFIGRAIASVLAQDFTDWEMIIVDDCSTDNTQAIISSYSADPRIHYIQNKTKQSIARSRNQALARVVGKYVAVLDSDDAWLDSSKLSKQFAFLEEHVGCALVGSFTKIVSENGEIISSIEPPTIDSDIRKTMLLKNPFVHSSVLYDREAVLKVGGYNEELTYCEDYDLWLRLGAAHDMANLPEFLTAYTLHSSNVTNANINKVARINIKLIAANPQYPHYYPALLKAMLRSFKFFCLRLLKPAV